MRPRSLRKTMDLSAATGAEIRMVDEQRQLLILAQVTIENKSRNQALLDLGKARPERIEVEKLHQPLRDRRHALPGRGHIDAAMVIEAGILDLEKNLLLLGRERGEHERLRLCQPGRKDVRG